MYDQLILIIFLQNIYFCEIVGKKLWADFFFISINKKSPLELMLNVIKSNLRINTIDFLSRYQLSCIGAHVESGRNESEVLKIHNNS